MHIPTKYHESDTSILHAFMHEYPFATLICQTAEGLDAHHIPLILGEDGVLRGHVSRANRVWKDIATDSVLAIFHGENTYISPSFYPSKQIDGKAVPTWNYSAVHAHGTITFVQDKVWLWETLNALSNFHERDFAEPWQIADAPPEYIERMLGAIVGFEIKISKLEGKFKLSQDKSAANLEGIRAGLIKQGKNPGKLVSKTQ